MKTTEVVTNLTASFGDSDANINFKVHYFCHLDRFPEKLEDVADEQNEQSNEGIIEMETWYQGRWDTYDGRLLLVFKTRS